MSDENQIQMRLSAQSAKSWAITAVVLASLALGTSATAIFFTVQQTIRMADFTTLSQMRLAQLGEADSGVTSQPTNGLVPQIAAAVPITTSPPVATPITIPPQAPEPHTASAFPVQPAASLAPPTVAAGADGTMYAHDAQTGQYFSMNRNGDLFVTQRDTIPGDVLARLAQSSTPGAGASPVPTLEDVTQTARNAIAAEAEPEELAINQLLARPEVAAGIIEGVAGLASITIPGDAQPAKPVYIFMDPRCPHCHNLYRQLDGRVETVWIPTLALGESPGSDGMMATIMGEVNLGRTAEGRITSSAFVDDPMRVNRLETQLRNQPLARTASSLTKDQDDILTQNLTVMRQLYGPQAHLMGVPTIIVQNDDGTAELFRGYSPEAVDAIVGLVANREG